MHNKILLAIITGNALIKTPYTMKVMHPKILSHLNCIELLTIKEKASSAEAK